MTIKIGDHLPDAKLKIMTSDGPGEVSVSDYFSGSKVALFAVPGAFTPTCHAAHLPGFLNNMDALKAKGIDKVACLSVNDVFVMNAWADASDAKGKIDFLADGSADFTRAVGLDLDGSGLGMGIRSLRYSMLVDDGIVKSLNVEDVPSKAEQSGAEALLGQL
ncbi:MAG: peroxiredoxin [Fimbriimonadaceae bacterium]|nr:peroxiredoxin [Alphaproteobacteria bacterium]